MYLNVRERKHDVSEATCFLFSFTSENLRRVCVRQRGEVVEFGAGNQHAEIESCDSTVYFVSCE